ncbi:hypothetical protein [Brucella intermedia]|uniref:hypothetical protein n=1 Tax=Brucella intermedia TaxID=94625 RepID=UPI002248FC4D|nr:hypothetical protein [Brucella intermedia]
MVIIVAATIIPEDFRLANLLAVIMNRQATARYLQSARCSRSISRLNPKTKVMEADFDDVNVWEIVDTGRSGFIRADAHRAFFKELYGVVDPEIVDYAIPSHVYRSEHRSIRRSFKPRMTTYRPAGFTQRDFGQARCSDYAGQNHGRGASCTQAR